MNGNNELIAVFYTISDHCIGDEMCGNEWVGVYVALCSATERKLICKLIGIIVQRTAAAMQI